MVFSKFDTTELATNYLVALNNNPIRTKAQTSAVFNALSELIASIVTGDKDPATGSYLSPRVAKMAAYGFFVSGPLSHYLVEWLQRAFQGRTSTASKLLQILASNLFVTPIQSLVFLTFMSIFAGASTPEQVIAAVKLMYLPVLRNSWVTSPFLLAFAQKYVPRVAWVPFFSFFSFLLSTYNNIKVKRRRQALERDLSEKKQ